MATDKRAKYRQKMDGLGLVQANEWVPKDRRGSTPPGWKWRDPPAVRHRDEITRLRKVVSDLHPDKGGPGGSEFKAAKDALDALTGRA